jgi:hypothetical protein
VVPTLPAAAQVAVPAAHGAAMAAHGAAMAAHGARKSVYKQCTEIIGGVNRRFLLREDRCVIYVSDLLRSPLAIG